MTLAQVITKTIARLTVDLESEVDTTVNEDMATAVSLAAKQWTRDTLCLWSYKSAMTPTTGNAQINLLDPTKCADLVFLCRGVHINGSWLTELDPQDLMPGGDYDNFAANANSDTPGYWVPMAPGSIWLASPPRGGCLWCR